MLLVFRPEQADLLLVNEEASTQVHTTPRFDRVLDVVAVRTTLPFDGECGGVAELVEVATEGRFSRSIAAPCPEPGPWNSMKHPFGVRRKASLPVDTATSFESAKHRH